MIKKKYYNIFNKHFRIKKDLKRKLLEKKKDITINNFQDWDSMKHVSILIKIQETFKIKITPKNSKLFNSFRSGLEYLEKK